MKPPIIIRLMGGLGNQLFQFAFASSLQACGDRRVVVDLSWFDRQGAGTRRHLSVDPHWFGFRTIHFPRYVCAALDRLGMGFHVVERSSCDDVPSAIRPWSVMITGYFQRYSYAEASRNLFARVFDRYIPGTNSSLPYVAVHVRLGDYLESTEVCRTHGVTDPIWLLGRGRTLANKLGIERVRLFSDDPRRVAQLLGGNLPEGVDVDASVEPWDAIAGMRSSSGLVMSNSSLSWWAAYAATRLDGRDLQVIMPTPWMVTPSCFDLHLAAPCWSVEPRVILQPPAHTVTEGEQQCH